MVQHLGLEPAADNTPNARARAREALLWAIALGFGTLLDQLTKQWAELHVRPRGIVTVIPELLDLRYVRNPGAFFSLGADLAPDLRRVLLCGASVLVLALIAGLYRRERSSGAHVRLGLALLAAGAIGNLIDRAKTGEVVDFVHLHVGALLHWATFNLADVAITLGLGLLAYHVLRPRPVAAADAARSASPEAARPHRHERRQLNHV